MKKKKSTLKNKHDTFSLSLAALGVVYGDIGTSPLYALRESLGNLPINLLNILGVLSFIFWALIAIISVKYLILVFRADNEGEGGILALLALLKRINHPAYKFLFLVGIFGGGLMLGDGMLTPAISVLSAVEGLNVISPVFSSWIIPLACVILISLFAFQSYGTAKIGFSFGPILFVWFCTIAILGILRITDNPVVFKAINPYYAWEFLHYNSWKGYALLGGIFLVVTGGEALYADLGHFGKKPIRITWFSLVLPCLLLNYFGQGAFLLDHPSAITNPFYGIAPMWFSVPLIFLATMATVIASQAVISATFSLTKQAVLLGLYPHLPIIQTSETERGQVYVPQMNLVLGIGTFILIVTFKSSSALAHAYGIAVNLVMVLTTLMIIYVARKVWKWNVLKIIFTLSIFLFIDLMFLGANVQKIMTGGWVPILFASICAFIMFTWHRGMEFLRNEFYMKRDELSKILKQLHYKTLNRLPNTLAIFITDIYDKSGGSFLQFLKLSRAMPENILILNYVVENVPYVPLSQRFGVNCLAEDVCQLTLRYGFMDFIDFPKALAQVNKTNLLTFNINVERATYIVETPNVIASERKRTLPFDWQEKLFAFLVRNYSSNLNIEFYRLPFNRTVSLGTYCVL